MIACQASQAGQPRTLLYNIYARLSTYRTEGNFGEFGDFVNWVKIARYLKHARLFRSPKFKFLQYPTESRFAKFNARQNYGMFVNLRTQEKLHTKQKIKYRRSGFNCESRANQVRPNCESNNCDCRPRTLLQHTLNLYSQLKSVSLVMWVLGALQVPARIPLKNYAQIKILYLSNTHAGLPG